MLTACSTQPFLLFAHRPALNTTTNDIYPRRFSCLLPEGWYWDNLPTQHCWDISITAARDTMGELQQQISTLPAYWGNYPKKQPISIWSHTENVSLQHCRLHNFYYISQYRSSEINQGDESIFHMLKLVLTATGSHKTLLSIKEMDFLFRVWSKATRALLKQVMLKVLKHSASRFKPSSTTGNHRGV